MKAITGIVLLICSFVLGSVLGSLVGEPTYKSTEEYLGGLIGKTIVGFIIVYGVFYRGLKRGTLLEDLGLKSSIKQSESAWNLTKIVKYSLVLLGLVIVISVLVLLLM